VRNQRDKVTHRVVLYLIKVKLNLQQATKAQRGSRGLALLLL